MDELLNEFYRKNSNQIKRSDSIRQKLDNTLTRIREEDKAEDSDDDHFNFGNARVEEAEDRLLEEF